MRGQQATAHIVAIVLVLGAGVAQSYYQPEVALLNI